MTGSASTPNFVSIWANLSFAAVMPALVKADSTRRIQISMFALSNEGKSTFLGTKRKSDGWTVVAAVVAGAAAACDRRTASSDAAIDVSVAALTVASTKALIEAGSMAKSEVSSEGKKVPAGAVGDGVGVLVARFRILA